MLKIISDNITLENVKKSNYWYLISLIVWGHYKEEKYQDDSKIEISEQWNGVRNGGSSNGVMWNDPNHTEEGYIRTLNSILIKFTRSDYTVYIHISVNRNSINYFGCYNDAPYGNISLNTYNSVTITNWLLENNFYKFEPKELN